MLIKSPFHIPVEIQVIPLWEVKRGIHWYLKTLLYCLLLKNYNRNIFLNISIVFYSFLWIFSSFFSYHNEILFAVFYFQILWNVSVFCITENLSQKTYKIVSFWSGLCSQNSWQLNDYFPHKWTHSCTKWIFTLNTTHQTYICYNTGCLKKLLYSNLTIL